MQEQKAQLRPASTLQRISRRLHRLSGDERIFGISIFLLAVHLADDIVENQGFGGVNTPYASLLTIFLMPFLFALYLQRGRAVRATLAAVLGLGGIFYSIATSLAHIVIAGVSGSDFTGVLFAGASVVLLWLAFRIAFRGHRRIVQVLVIPLLLLAMVNWVVSPAMTAGVGTIAPRTASPSASSIGVPGAVDVQFLASDGVRLVGWYVPSQNGAAVIVLHGSHVTRASTLDYVRMLASQGYGVLAYDARGHGQSDGQTITKGWIEDNDIAGAVSFLGHQQGIDQNWIGALGLSMGAMDALRAAADGIGLRAVVADGAGPGTYEDSAIVDGQLLQWPFALSGDWMGYRGIELMSGLSEPASLRSIVNKIHVPVLLIASNNPGELTNDQVYRDQIGPTATLWYVPDAGHVQVLATHPQDYTTKVTTFLESSLS